MVIDVGSGCKVSACALDVSGKVAGLSADVFSPCKAPTVYVREATANAMHLQIFVCILRFKFLGSIVECRIGALSSLEITEDGKRLHRSNNKSSHYVLALVVVCGIELVAVEYGQLIVDYAKSVSMESASQELESEVSARS